MSTYTKEALYDLVWSGPVRDVAKRFGIASSVTAFDQRAMGRQMRAQVRVSRRHAMAMLAAAGASALTVDRSAARDAPPPRRIESVGSGITAILDPNQPIAQLATGFGGDMGPAEGPLWIREGGYLLFNDVNAARRYRYTPGQGVAAEAETPDVPTGTTRDLQGRTISCENRTRRVARTEADGSVTVVANSFQGKRLLRPNDVVVKSDGSIYFTDSGSSAAPEQGDVSFPAVYRVSPDLRSIVVLNTDMVKPNGLAFSPDESILYVNDSRACHTRAYNVLANGALATETSRVFADLAGSEPGKPDGIKVDTLGNLYTGGSGGLYVISPRGRTLARIIHGDASTTNLAFGGEDWKTLYFTSRTTLYSVRLRVAGIPVPVTQ